MCEVPLGPIVNVGDQVRIGKTVYFVEKWIPNEIGTDDWLELDDGLGCWASQVDEVIHTKSIIQQAIELDQQGKRVEAIDLIWDKFDDLLINLSNKLEQMGETGLALGIIYRTFRTYPLSVDKEMNEADWDNMTLDVGLSVLTVTLPYRSKSRINFYKNMRKKFPNEKNGIWDGLK